MLYCPSPQAEKEKGKNRITFLALVCSAVPPHTYITTCITNTQEHRLSAGILHLDRHRIRLHAYSYFAVAVTAAAAAGAAGAATAVVFVLVIVVDVVVVVLELAVDPPAADALAAPAA